MCFQIYDSSSSESETCPDHIGGIVSNSILDITGSRVSRLFDKRAWYLLFAHVLNFPRIPDIIMLTVMSGAHILPCI